MNKKTCEPQTLWTPSRTQVENAHMTQFARSVGLESLPYERLHRFSVAEPEAFWESFWQFSGTVGEGAGPAMARDEAAPMTGTRFFPERRLNFAENMLMGDPDGIAVIESDEDGIRQQVTLAELRHRVAQAQAGLRSLDVKPGDRIAGMVANNLDAFVMLLATSSLGAIWSSCSPEFGLTGIVDRFGQISPRILVLAADYLYNGRRHDIAGKAADIARQLPGLEHIVTLGDARISGTSCEVHALADICDPSATEPDFIRLPFDHPLYIVYTSGTTGLPKCIVHRAGGTLLNLRKEHMLHCDIKPGDRVMYYTNTAWMMYHWLIAARASGAAIVLYDGAAIPKKNGRLNHGALWQIAEQAKVTHFGTSPKYLTLLQQDGYRPGTEHDLASLRLIASAGAPLTKENFEWVYGEVKRDLCLASISGGTEILGCFVMSNPTLPIHAGEIQCPALGMAVNVLDDRGAPVVGHKGDLVCTEPFPSMPVTFWGDNGWERYLDTYFSERPEIWTHGDLAEFTASGGMVISGRTDTTLKPGGVRIGTGEIYRVVDAISQLDDSLVIGYPNADDMDIWLYVVTKPGHVLDDSLIGLIRERLLKDASPRHVPKRILSVPEIPYTLSGKKVEKAVLQFITGREVKNRGSLINPDCLDAFLTAAEQRLEVKQASGATI